MNRLINKADLTLENYLQFPMSLDLTKNYEDQFIPLNSISHYLFKKNRFPSNDQTLRAKLISNIHSWLNRSYVDPLPGDYQDVFYFDIEATSLFTSSDCIVTEVGFEFKQNNKKQFYRCFLNLEPYINKKFSAFVNSFDQSLSESEYYNKNIKVFNSISDMDTFVSKFMLEHNMFNKVPVIGNNLICDVKFLESCSMLKTLSVLDIPNSIDQTLFNKFLRIFKGKSYNRDVLVFNKLHTTLECYHLFQRREASIKNILG